MLAHLVLYIICMINNAICVSKVTNFLLMLISMNAQKDNLFMVD